MTKREAGAMGGRRTFERHGRDHMSAIGKRGFAALATFARGGRKAALGRLVARGRLARRWSPDLPPAEMDELYAAVGL